MSLPPKLSPAAIMQEKHRAIIRNPFALLLHTWRLRRVRWAFSTLNRRLAAYEAAYGLDAVRLTDEDLRTAGLIRKAY
ncbi:hypothetical protein MKK84_14490 [Methylobacterium sp. E-065]|uniref:hypothetical protein n=1 Tax=Methylobacterium sp. E-065 TaxID=2836583 RepID=UPI001FBB2571|nr:hypothetical protein [Methylobacterium sp. E-065]MCJ2018631.1 hypothetical protein [Methylobacterium sp. E-065]